MRQFLYIAMLLLFARVCNPCAAQQPNKPLIDTARINAMRDSAGSRIMQVFDVDMLSKCLQVKQIENIRSLSLLKLNTPLRDTIEAFRVGYGTDILVHSYISSEQFWPKVIFNPNRLTRDIGNATKSPAVGFDVSFTTYGRGSERKFAIDITNQATANLLSDAQLTTLKGVTKEGIKGQFRKLSPDGKDSVNASLFRGIATLRGYWENELSKCNIQKVTFTPIAKPIYGFDTEPNETMKNFYERLVLSGRNYNVPWKSIEAGKEEDIIARISLKDSNPATHKVNFRREKASPPIVKANGDGTYTLTLTGGSNKDEEIIEAFYTDTLPGGKTKESVVGKIKVKSYSPIKSKVIPVKMNGASFSESTVALENALNDIYKQAAVSWTVAEPISVTVDQNTWDVDEKDGVLLIETSPLRRYSREMQAIIDAVKKDGKYDSEASYAIITDLPNSEGYAGYMPLKSDFAFIFTKSNGDLKKLIPHELGHGVFYLKHPQDEYHILDATDNLMDKYAVGTTLWKPQWDWIGDPSWRLYMFQEENQGASEDDFEKIYQLVLAKAKELYSNQNVIGVIHSKSCSEKVEKYTYSSQVINEKTVLRFDVPKKDGGSIRKIIILYKGNDDISINASDTEFNFSKDIVLKDETLTLIKGNNSIVDCSNYLDKLACCDLCNANGSTTLESYINALYDAANSCGENKLNNYRLIDKAQIITESQRLDIEKRLIVLKERGIDAKVYITSRTSEQSIINEVQQKINSTEDSKISLWFELSNGNIILKDFNIGSSSIKLSNGKNESEIVKNLFEFTKDKTFENLLDFDISLLESLADWIKYLAIPEKYWNPNVADYNPTLFKIFSTMTLGIGAPILMLNSDIKKAYQLEFSLSCGFYNGLINTLAALPDGASLIIKLIINKDGIWQKMGNQIKAMQVECGKSNSEVFLIGVPSLQGIALWGYSKCAWGAIVDHFSEGDQFQKAHSWGKFLFDVASFAVGYLKAGKITTAMEAINSLDAFYLAFKIVKPVAGMALKAFRCGKQLLSLTVKEGRYAFKLIDKTGVELVSDWEKSIKWVEAVDESGNLYQVGIYDDVVTINGNLHLVKNPDGTLVEFEGEYYLAEIGDNAGGQVGVVKKAEKVGELVGKYDWGLVKRYFQHIQDVTGRAVGQKQIDKLKDALRGKEYKKLTPEEYALHTKEYTPTRREKMIKEWEENTGQTWPIDENGRKYQLHHIIEQQYGGPNEWWNSHPAKFPDEHQGGIHAAGSPSRELFK